MENKIVYLVGIEYDDFDDGGFNVIGVCDTLEIAKEVKEKAIKEFDKVSTDKITIKDFITNELFY